MHLCGCVCVGVWWCVYVWLIASLCLCVCSRVHLCGLSVYVVWWFVWCVIVGVCVYMLLCESVLCVCMCVC